MNTSAASSQQNKHDDWKSVHSPWLIAFSVMLATFMEVLDTAVANVALPHIAGNLSASVHEATWVLTSYLISNAIILPATAWLSGFFGRKRFLLVCLVVFTFASALCGMAFSLQFLIAARILQGIGGGALQPISQAILLESFPKEKRGVAMAVFALGVVVAPIIGPTVGGWITDNYSWRWIFYINLPVGVLAFLMCNLFVEDPPYLKRNSMRTIDYIGFSLMAIGLGTLQLVLDKGQEADWFATPWICWATGIIAVSLIGFIIWELRTKDPVVHLRAFADRNFSIGLILGIVLGSVLYSTIALLPIFLQSLRGYSALTSGLVLSPRGIAAFIMSLIMGRIITLIDSRYFVAAGLFILGVSCFMLSALTLNNPTGSMLPAILVSGAGITGIFIPLTTLTMQTLPREELGNATGLFNLTRNIGGSVGIAVTATLLARLSQVHQNYLVGYLTPYDQTYQMHLATLERIFMPAGTAAPSLALGTMYHTLQQQAMLLAFVDNFRLLGVVCFVCVPLAFFFKKADITGKPVMVH